MNNSKKVNGKSSRRVYSRSDKAITLIALIVTIIVLLILAGVTINLAVNNQGIFNKAKTATRAYKNATENEQKGIDEADKEIENNMPIPGSTLLRKNAPKISVSGLKYADLDGDGIADGIIVADISKDSTDTKVTSELREYSENKNYKYTNADGSTADGTLITCTNNTGIPQYYVLSLADYDGYAHYWYKEAYGKMSDYSKFTSKDFGKGKENTEEMIDRMKNHSDSKYNGVDYGEPTTGTNADVWNIIEDKVKEGWFVPSREEWKTFMINLKAQGLTTLNYSSSFGLGSSYWSSSQYYYSTAWRVLVASGYVTNDIVNNAYGLRLCETF